MLQVQEPQASTGKLHITCLHAPATDTVPHSIAAACADGFLRLMTASGKVEKTGEGGHSGAVTQVRWNHTGTEIATGGEDGAVKTWSSLGMLRTTVAHGDTPIYSLVWSPDSTKVCVTEHHVSTCYTRLSLKEVTSC